MGKRQFRGAENGDGPRKRQRVVHEAPTSEVIHTSRQLRQLLAFDPDLGRSRHGLQSFKLLLDSLLSRDDDTNSAEKRQQHELRFTIVKEYLQSTKPTEDDETSTYLPDIMQTWSHAGQVNNENLLSAVPVVLALLLKLLSQSLELTPIGLGICRTLLQKRQQELISRSLSADKGKAFIISPTLRMLREAVCFDGGAIARPMFRARMSMLKSLARNMGIVHIGEEPEDIKKPSPRTNAVQFFLSALKYLHPEAKKELLAQRDVVTALTRDIKQDLPYLVLDLLNGLRDYVLLDSKVPREAKSNLLSSTTLIKISGLYYYRQANDDLPSIPDAAHEFLMTACTNPSCGVLRQDTGLYPREADPNAAIPSADLEELGLEAIVWMNKFKTEVPVRNFVLSNLLQNLRPWSSLKQSELITSIFKVAPELIADFFIKNKSFTFEPKLSATWIGYAAFLFNTVALPLHEYFCRGSGYAELPPPTSIVMDNILPLPLNQKALSRCLTNKSRMISFFATRILILAVQKLDTAVRMHQDPAHSSKFHNNQALWTEAARRLVDEFCQRSPGIKEMINSYRSIPEDDILHREAASQLLRLYYEVIPQVALMAKFDVAPLLETALKRLSKQEQRKETRSEEVGEDDPRDFALSLKELENLLAIAGYSPGMRWFAATEQLTLSPFLTLLKVYVEAPHGVSLAPVRQVLDFVAVEQQVVPAKDKGHPGISVLLETLKELMASSPLSLAVLWPFLDKCLSRCTTAPVKYLEMLQDLGPKDAEDEVHTVNPLVAAIIEQLPFAAKAADSKSTLDGLGRFLPKFLGYSAAAGESKPLLEAALAVMSDSFAKGLGKSLAVPKKHPFKQAGVGKSVQAKQDRTKTTANGDKSGPGDDIAALDSEQLERVLDVPDSLATDNSALVKWQSKSVDELVDEGYAISLISLLASEHASIRKEALVNILKMASKVQQSEYEEKEQIWLLLSELAETARVAAASQASNAVAPLPSTIVAFACHAVNVLRDPTHSLYPKINSFLTRGPFWSVDRVPLADEVLTEEPTVGDSYYSQLNWLLTYLLDGLRTSKDLELFHKKRAKGPLFERLLAVAGNPYMRTPLRMQVLRILYRASKIEGGSTTLVTRFGVVSWLEELLKMKKSMSATQSQGGAGTIVSSEDELAAYKGLLKRIWETCDKGRVEGWSKGGVESVIV
ncbi:ribosome 60S biogenesis N-terminal domain-containing protein [Neurospora intermedia]|uniref:Ribosome 60S biogenesis N-terminal domain-containing protein n=1 Tax=Neurospora intermedia TaxID=5142 RepID=A0ABR3DI29_NEUIN